jgi:hypothetical protein
VEDIAQVGQRLPPAFAKELRQFLRTEPIGRGNDLLRAMTDNGWTYAAIAAGVGYTREWIRRRAQRGDEYAASLPWFPPPPRKLGKQYARRRMELDQAAIDELIEMAAIARTVNGATSADAVERRVSEEYSAKLANYVNLGFSPYYLAKTVGATTAAIEFRLRRHGYRPMYASQKFAYSNRGKHQRAAERCGPGHLQGKDLYVDATGHRVCRACQRRNYHERKART